MYSKQRYMKALQVEIEDITGQNEALELDFENEIDSKNKNQQQVGQIISSIDNIYETCQMLTELQTSKRRTNTLADIRDSHEKVKNLQEKLDQAVTKISELTDVLKHLDKEYTPERYYEDLV